MSIPNTIVEKTLITLDKFLSLKHINKYPYNLNSKLRDNIIETKNEIELEYIQDYNNPANILYNVNDKKGKKGKGNITIYIF